MANENTSLLQPVLTIQDYFKHFPSFKYQPLLLNNEERFMLARSITCCTETINDITQHPSLKPLIGYIRNEFERLRIHKRWNTDDDVYRTNQATFNTAVVNTCEELVQWAKRDLEMETKVCAVPDLAGFFKPFEDQVYNYESQNPPLAEFDRLCKLQNWGEETKRQRRSDLCNIMESHGIPVAAPTLAVPGLGHRFRARRLPLTPTPLDLDHKSRSLLRFFVRFQGESYNYNPEAYPPTEFERLCKIIKWVSEEAKKRDRNEFRSIYGMTDCWTFYGRTDSFKYHLARRSPAARRPNGGSVHSELSKATIQLSEFPIALFFRSFNGYTYKALTPTEEFSSLAEYVMEEMRFEDVAAQWKQSIPSSEFHRPLGYWKSEVYRKLQDEFYQVVEEQFEWFVDIQCQRTGMEKHEYLLLFFELGDGKKVGDKEITRRDAVDLLSKININIYDFLDHQHELLAMENEVLPPVDSTGKQIAKVIDLSQTSHHKSTTPSPKVPTKFPTVELLGMYCEITGRIFNMASASKSGILVRLLKLVGVYFGPKTRNEYLRTRAALSRRNQPIPDIDVMMILKLERFYRGPHRRWNQTLENEARENMLRYRALFDAVRRQNENQV